MKLQRVKLDQGQTIWLVLDDDYLPIEPIQEFIRYLSNIERSPNTIRVYAYHLKLYWEYLISIKKHWNEVKLTDLAEFISWLRAHCDYQQDVIYFSPQTTKRTESTINAILGCLTTFYDFHHQLGNTTVTLTRTTTQPSRRYKPLLHHLNRHKQVKTRILSLKQTRKIPKVLDSLQIKKLSKACINLRDKFLITLLYETGVRIGQALGLKHEDIKTFDNEIHIIPRNNLVNEARTKSKYPNVIHVSSSLMHLYGEFVIHECENITGDYVFIHTQRQTPGKPLNYRAVRDLFERLSKKVDFHVTPHMLRHSHATELIRAGWDAAFVQKRLGHASVQTTLNIYTHLSPADLKKAFLDYQKIQEKINHA